ncbi:HlyD family efflux transporter periplasmic adaptor subunit [Terasakiella pusilla]|uniref:HlyD family efflux transporter periplasmic adaptor subunit n=1 Tax=Terasakiella pusilla TaxID=64973 RepID=UPI003AA81504
MQELSASAGEAALPLLRRDLKCHEGPRRQDGSPTWTLEDPARGQYLRIGWAEMEILTRWGMGNAKAILADISRTTSLQLKLQDVQSFGDFLQNFQLIEPRGEKDVQRLAQIAEQRKTHWFKWIFHNYLFLRLPLCRPDRFLGATLPYVKVLASKYFLILTLCAAVLGLALIARQFDTFLHTFLYFFTLEGALMAAVTVAAVKVLHELGHAYVSKNYGCRVGTMGVAFLVLWPVLYTDTTDAWRLTRRHQRMAIGGAGMMVELAVAAWATLLWSFLPDGLLRSAVFTLATTTWILTLAVNLMPLMRFDGYFLLSDLLDVPNLQQRGFALARWRMRETLFGLKEKPPHRFAPWLHKTVLIYAFATWIYRFFLFLGIALLVYHFAVKVVGIALFVIEIGYFIVLPVYGEIKVWWEKRSEMSLNRNVCLSIVAVVAILGMFIFPWQTQIDAPALLRAKQQVNFFMPVDGKLQQIGWEEVRVVKKGQVLFRMSAPDQDLSLKQLDLDIETLKTQSRYQERTERDSARQHVARQALDLALRRRDALMERQKQLEIHAPFDGVLADYATPLSEGDWLGKGEWLATLTGKKGDLVEAFVAEEEWARLEKGATAWFIPEELGLPRQKLVVVDIAATATRRLDFAPELTSPYDGPIAAYSGQNNALTPAKAVYRVVLSSTEDRTSPRYVARGTVRITADAQSPASALWRTALTFFIRETGF